MRLLALALLLAVPAAQAQLYKCVDEKGNTRYSDKPFTDCKTRKTIATPPPSDRRQAAPSSTRGALPPEAKVPQVPGVAQKKPLLMKKGAPAQPLQQTADAAKTEHDKKYAAARCRELKEEEAWLRGPRGAKLEDRDARLGQVRQAMAGCP